MFSLPPLVVGFTNVNKGARPPLQIAIAQSLDEALLGAKESSSKDGVGRPPTAAEQSGDKMNSWQEPTAPNK